MVTFKEAYKEIMLDMELARESKRFRDEALADLRIKMFMESMKNTSLKNEATDDRPGI